MAALFKLSNASRRCARINVITEYFFRSNQQTCLFSTTVKRAKSRGVLKFSLMGITVGSLVGFGYSYNKINEFRQVNDLEGTQKEVQKLKDKPPIMISRKVVYSTNKDFPELTLFQYQSCPFCCKVRAFLDYYGISYNVIEVNPIFRSQISWSEYKKVPILLAKVNDGYVPLNDSSMIISLLSSYLSDDSQSIEELIHYYPSIALRNDEGKIKHEIINKYFLMDKKQQFINEIADKDEIDERNWRTWADDVLVHTLSPNVYRTLDESYETFNSFSDVGEWEKYFTWWERMIIINVGACAMWLIGKGLKKKYNLKEEVRQSLYDEVNYWLQHLKKRGVPFMGGQNPNLSDLAVYGILKSIEGSSAFKDLLNHTNISTWYNTMKEKVDTQTGSVLVNS